MASNAVENPQPKELGEEVILILSGYRDSKG
jgi:hypothetical protein